MQITIVIIEKSIEKPQRIKDKTIIRSSNATFEYKYKGSETIIQRGICALFPLQYN